MCWQSQRAQARNGIPRVETRHGPVKDTRKHTSCATREAFEGDPAPGADQQRQLTSV